jgi:hypothetical protein
LNVKPISIHNNKNKSHLGEAADMLGGVGGLSIKKKENNRPQIVQMMAIVRKTVAMLCPPFPLFKNETEEILKKIPKTATGTNT